MDSNRILQHRQLDNVNRILYMLLLISMCTPNRINQGHVPSALITKTTRKFAKQHTTCVIS